ncbi:MAG: alpha/beta hydrolase [Myxococcota bacterium]|nr:alpha/beta hydrolase [Myxococcota bacterium]MEE2702880.1 alpha/beta hydrolase [Myxococcota bacterium]
MPFVELRGLRFYYETRGKGPRLLLFSGSGGDLRRRPGLLDSPLAEHFELLCHDQRGLGQSDRPDIDYAMVDYAEDAAALLDAVGWERCRVLGVSFGGMVAQEFVVRFGESVERLVLACTSSGGEGGASYPLHELAALPEEERALQSLELSDTRMDAEWRERHPGAARAMAKLRDPAQDPGAGEPNREIGARRQLEARRRHDTWDRLPQIKTSTLCCGGRYDGIASPENMERLAGRIPGANLELFEGGHLFLMQDPRAWERIVEFLR